MLSPVKRLSTERAGKVFGLCFRSICSACFDHLRNYLSFLWLCRTHALEVSFDAVSCLFFGLSTTPSCLFQSLLARLRPVCVTTATGPSLSHTHTHPAKIAPGRPRRQMPLPTPHPHPLPGAYTTGRQTPIKLRVRVSMVTHCCRARRRQLPVACSLLLCPPDSASLCRWCGRRRPAVAVVAAARACGGCETARGARPA